jgi:hypothetical protein
VTATAKRRAEKRRKRENKQRAATALEQPERLSRPFQLIVEALDDLGEYTSLTEAAPDAAALAEERVRDAATRLAEAAAPYDVFDVLELVRHHNLMADPETYSEATHEGSAAVIEIVALTLAARGARTPVSGAATLPQGAWQAAEPVEEAAKDAVRAGSLLPLFGVGASGDPLARIGFGTVLREASLRNVAYPHMVEDTLAALFDDVAVETECRRVAGVSGGGVRAVLKALEQLHEAAWQRRFDALEQIALMARSVTAEERANGLADDKRAQGPALLDAAFASPSSASTFKPAEVASEAGVDEATVASIVDLFALDMVQEDPAAAAVAFFRGDNPLRTRPLLRSPDGSFVVVHGGLLLPAVRERLEQVLQSDSRAWDVYQKHRGKYLETTALGYLARMLAGSRLHAGFEYFVPDPGAAPAQAVPGDFTKLVETDGLILLDDVAVILEAKAVAMRAQSRTGDPLRLRQDLMRTITAAAAQADRLREQIRQHGGVRLRDNTWLDLSHVRETHTVAVSLDDLSGIATLTTELVAAGLLPQQQLPWIVGLHDLRIISELVARPAELLLYLRRRTEPKVTLKFHAIDELDLFLHMYRRGLYVEPDPDAVFAELPQFGPPATAARRRHRRQGMEFITTLTGELDAWYLHKHGYRVSPAPKPRIGSDPELLELVDAVAAAAEPGWLAIGTALMEAAHNLQRQWARQGSELLATTAQDGRNHSFTAIGGTRRDDSFVLAWFSLAPGVGRAAHTARLTQYLSAKKHQMQAARGMGLLFDAAVGGFVGTIYDNRVPSADPTLDALGSGLRPVDRAQRSKPPPASREAKQQARKGGGRRKR